MAHALTLAAIEHRADLSRANTLRLPCIAEHAAAPTTLSEVRELLALARARRWPVTVLGGGSNVLLPPVLEGLVLRPALCQWWGRCEGDTLALHVGAGVNWHQLVMATAARGLWGIENLALIPGECGAAPVQNIGAYGVELGDVLEAVQVVDRASGRVQWLSARECMLGYRDSIFKGALEGQVVITQLVLRLSRRARPVLSYGDLAARVGANPTPLAVAEAVCAIRRAKLPDPAVLANAGSFFKNPIVSAGLAQPLLARHAQMPHFPQPDGRVKLAAGWLIDQCGWKGRRDGAFGVHAQQALVVVHDGQGSREELMRFANAIVADVKARFGVTLEPEPRWL
ncbi:UDP-N-acetylmuramate dehydrogenase [Halomonas dongshanensis]|uniref:UDP-N-acetylenolpyruvoylglucosamine reductase n=1 Tax=Halomonas dongshanensis TaxID=2890835 RepID=A0ABT2EEZ4_9GAMM|nr:UDP-N-acetylmuramate dehydrogenase [Halomonas dongshanensis]MCS2610059.1 UDP-N-acetylmuramate dehydrogenase [Halomonas dongshanensis]